MRKKPREIYLSDEFLYERRLEFFDRFNPELIVKDGKIYVWHKRMKSIREYSKELKKTLFIMWVNPISLDYSRLRISEATTGKTANRKDRYTLLLSPGSKKYATFDNKKYISFEIKKTTNEKERMYLQKLVNYYTNFLIKKMLKDPTPKITVAKKDEMVLWLNKDNIWHDSLSFFCKYFTPQDIIEDKFNVDYDILGQTSEEVIAKYVFYINSMIDLRVQKGMATVLLQNLIWVNEYANK